MHTSTTTGWTDTRDTRQFAAEIKFLVDRPRADAISHWARAHFAPDPHATGGPHGDRYSTTSVYFDTDELDVANRRGSYARSKYRARRYGRSGVVFLERKLRTSRLLTKRRSIVMLSDLDLLHRTRADGDWSGMWFHRRLQARSLRPVCQISYERMARVARTDYGFIRLTIDDQVVAQPVNALSFDSGEGRRIFEDQVVLEFKFRVALPVAFKDLIAEFNLVPQSVSKYRLAARRFGWIANGAPADAPQKPSTSLRGEMPAC
jgi:hypothetical protein